MENRVNKPRPKSATVRRPTTTEQSGLAAGGPNPPPLGRLKGLPVRPQANPLHHSPVEKHGCRVWINLSPYYCEK